MTDHTTPELLACPFCGGNSHLDNTDHPRSDGSHLFWVDCYECGISGKITETADQAIKQWNTRATTQERAAPREGVSDQSPSHSPWFDYSVSALGVGRAVTAAPQEGVSVPPGWKLVPIEPTTEMRTAGSYAVDLHSNSPLGTWAAMVAAAPQPPASAPPATGNVGADPDRWCNAAMSPEIDGRLSSWLTNGATLHPLTINLVVRFARALSAKLAAAELKYGYSDGWKSKDWMDECRAHLIEHIGKGDPRDVAAYCAFLWHHGESTAAALPPGRGMVPMGEIPLKVNQLIGHARRLQGFANRLETTNALLSKEVRTVAYDVEKTAQGIYDGLGAHGIKEGS